MTPEIGVPTLLGIFVLPAVAFALFYFPVVTRLSRGLVSPYVKADIRKRLVAATIDGLVVVTLYLLYRTAGSVLYIVASASYLLFRDAVGGQSIGKVMSGLVVISLETGRASTVSGSVRRNVLLLLPGANVVAIFLEARTILRDAQGQRLGDKLAQTQVVEAFGAKDFVKVFQDWLMSLSTGLGRGVGGRRRLPGRIDRAA